MTRETKISISILLFGLMALAIYWFIEEDKSIDIEVVKQKEESIILPVYPKSIYQDIPEVQRYIEDRKEIMSKEKAVLPLEKHELDSNGYKAQNIVLDDAEFLKDTVQNGKILHNDMMRVLPALVSSLDENLKILCKQSRCYQAEKYNFATNTTTRAIVDIDKKKVLSVERYENMQPDISQRLTRIAQAIALNAPEVKKALGFSPTKKDMSMANVRGSLRESPCENANHLCVAPTFTNHKKEQALWAIVDLTELKLVAAKWAGLGKTTTPACISERTLQNRYIMKNFCQKDTQLVKNGWEITYRLTGSDGLEIRDVKFKGKSILRSAKIVDWHVAYQQKGGEKLDTTTETYIEGRRVEYLRQEDGAYLFGYNDAMGCPMFSTSVVLPFNGPQVRKLKNSDGFMLTQDFRNPKWPMACNYRYENRFEFYDDGSFRVVGVNKGRGCGDNAIYRPVMRIDIALGGKENFYAWEDEWKLWEKENSEYVVASQMHGAGSRYPYKITNSADTQDGYYIEPNNGQFDDSSRGDNARLFVTQFKQNEGDRDLLTLGSCCDLKIEGVEPYINGENIIAENLVLWYVPHIRNDARDGHEYCWADTAIGKDGNVEVKVWPCTVGPKFVPVSKKQI